MEQTLKIGVIVKPQGIKGEVKVQPLTDDINRFKKLKEVIIDDKTYRVTNAVIGGGTVFLSLFGISDRNTAETFRGKYLHVNRENAVELEEGRYFIVDVIGCVLFDSEGSEIGEVIDIVKKNGGAKASTDIELRKELVEEMADVLMYYNDVMLCYGITEEELKQAYIDKFEKNMKRW